MPAAELEAAWEEWYTDCDASSRDGLVGLLRTMVKQWMANGEFLLGLTTGRGRSAS